MHRELASVEQMLDRDVRLEDIEMYIETCVDLPEDTRSALWLWAWAQINRNERRRAVGELIARTAYDLG
jgi:hypothetical protein